MRTVVALLLVALGGGVCAGCYWLGMRAGRRAQQIAQEAAQTLANLPLEQRILAATRGTERIAQLEEWRAFEHWRNNAAAIEAIDAELERTRRQLGLD